MSISPIREERTAIFLSYFRNNQTMLVRIQVTFILDSFGNIKVNLCVTVSFADIPDQINKTACTLIVKNSRESGSITAIVSFAANDKNAAILDRTAKFFRYHSCYGVGGVFHQDDRWNAVAVGRQAVDLAHLFGCEHLLHTFKLATDRGETEVQNFLLDILYYL